MKESNSKTVNDVSLVGGILIMGSLKWDQERADWRHENLNEEEQIAVAAPIRYGKLSSSRSCTFTMVFSSECIAPANIGKGIFVPFKNNPVNTESINLQVKKLIQTERKKKVLANNWNDWDWGAVVLHINPKHLINNSDKFAQINLFRKLWVAKFSAGFNPEEYRVGMETPTVNKEGLLQFSWPDNLGDIDFFIATAIKSGRDCYPTTDNIADRMIVNDYSEYFEKNIEYGITTFQDQVINERLSKGRP